MDELAGRVAILTGASRGIGPHIAWALVKERMNLLLAARDAAALERVAAAARAAGVEAVAVPADLTDGWAREALVARAEAELGGVDVLVNNAGVELTRAYDALSPDEIARVIEVNLTAPLLLARLALPGMLARGRGHVVNVSSLAGKSGPPHSEPYAATKAGLIGFTRSLRASYRGRGVSASVICPGFVDAGMYSALRADLGRGAPAWLGVSSPQAVARAVVRAIRADLPELIVNPMPMRPLLALAELFPAVSEWVIARGGIAELLAALAEARAQRPETTLQVPPP